MLETVHAYNGERKKANHNLTVQLIDMEMQMADLVSRGLGCPPQFMCGGTAW